MSSNNSFSQKKICFCKFAISYRSVMSCTLAIKTADLFVFNQQPNFSCFFKNETEAMEAIVCENRRSSSLPAAGDLSQGRTSATQRQKFHTDDVKSVRISAMDPTSQEPRSKLFNRENTVSRPELQSLSKKNDLLSFRCSPFHCLHDCIGKDHFRYNKIHC